MALSFTSDDGLEWYVEFNATGSRAMWQNRNSAILHRSMQMYCHQDACLHEWHVWSACYVKICLLHKLACINIIELIVLARVGT